MGVFLKTISIWEELAASKPRHLQVVVFGKTHEKVPSHGLIATQVGVNHHTLDTP